MTIKLGIVVASQEAVLRSMQQEGAPVELAI